MALPQQRNRDDNTIASEMFRNRSRTSWRSTFVIGGVAATLRAPYNHVMASARPASTALSVAFELFETGVALMRQNLRRHHPDAGDLEIDRLLTAWLHDRPGAEAGDAIGRSVDPHTRLR